MPLDKIKSLLERGGFECPISSSEETPPNRLCVLLGPDPQKRIRMLEIRITPQKIGPGAVITDPHSLPHRIQFHVQLPFSVRDMALRQVGSLLLFLNPCLDVPGFELHEVQGRVIYRYVWIAYPSVVDYPAVMSMMSVIMLNISLFSETIESLANGKASFCDLLTELTQAF